MADEANAKGTLALDSRDFTAAVNHFTEAIKLAPTRHDLYSNRYVAHASLHHYDEALSDAKKTVELKPDSVESHSHLGAAHLRLGLKQLEEAVEAYKKGLGIDPSNEALKSGLEEALAYAPMQNRFGDAFQGPEMWEKLNADPSTARFLKHSDFVTMVEEIQKNNSNLNIYWKDQRVKQALGVLLTAPFRTQAEGDVEIQEDEMAVPLSKEKKQKALKEKELGNAAYKNKDFITAVYHYSTAMVIDDEDITYLINRAAAYFEMGKVDECIKDCDKAIQRGIQLGSDGMMVAKALTRKGNALRKMADCSKDYEPVIASYQEALAKHWDSDTMQSLDRALRAKERLEKEEKLLIDMSGNLEVMKTIEFTAPGADLGETSHAQTGFRIRKDAPFDIKDILNPSQPHFISLVSNPRNQIEKSAMADEAKAREAIKLQDDVEVQEDEMAVEMEDTAHPNEDAVSEDLEVDKILERPITYLQFTPDYWHSEMLGRLIEEMRAKEKLEERMQKADLKNKEIGQTGHGNEELGDEEHPDAVSGDLKRKRAEVMQLIKKIFGKLDGAPDPPEEGNKPVGLGFAKHSNSDTIKKQSLDRAVTAKEPLDKWEKSALKEKEMGNKELKKGYDSKISGKCVDGAADESTSINNLPESLLCQILSSLPARYSVRSSRLSRRWRNLWLQVDAWDFTSSLGIPFVEVTNRFLNYSKQPIKKFRLNFDNDDVAGLSDILFQSWICNVISRDVSHLDIADVTLTFYHEIDEYEAMAYRMPLLMYFCQTLVDLRLNFVALAEPESVSLPCLKTMYLENVMYATDATLEKLVSNCLVLEELHVSRNKEHADQLRNVVVKSSSLKRLALVTVVHGGGHALLTVEIDCPALEYLRLFDDTISESFIIHTIGDAPVVDITLTLGGVLLDVDPLTATMLHDFFTAISTARSVKISSHTLEVMRRYFPKFEPLPQFSMLSSLEASFVQDSWNLMPAFLGGCPNLQSLILDLHFYMRSEKQLIELLEMPQGFFSTLKFVKLEVALCDRTAGSVNLAISAYFLRNCDVLEKLSVSASFSYYILDNIKKIPKKSVGCEIVVV